MIVTAIVVSAGRPKPHSGQHMGDTAAAVSSAAPLRGNAVRALRVRSWHWTRSARTCSHAGAWEPEGRNLTALGCSGDLDCAALHPGYGTGQCAILTQSRGVTAIRLSRNGYWERRTQAVARTLLDPRRRGYLRDRAATWVRRSQPVPDWK